MKRGLFAWDVDVLSTATVTTTDGVDSRVLFAHMDITALSEPVVLERVLDPNLPLPRQRPVLDFVFGGGRQPRLLSARALAALESFLRPNGELTRLSIRGVDQAFFAFTPRRVLDVLDEARSNIHPTSYGRYLRRAALEPHDYSHHDVFVVAGFERSQIFVTDAFVQAIEEAGLQGAEFQPTIA